MMMNGCGVGVVHQAEQEEVCGSFRTCAVVVVCFLNDLIDVHARRDRSAENSDSEN